MRMLRPTMSAAAFGLLLVASAEAAEAECKLSGFIKGVRAEQVEAPADTQYRNILAQAKAARALAPDDHPQVKRLRYLMARMLPFVAACNPRAADWSWEVSLLGSRQIHGVALPGGKIVVHYAALSETQLTDDELAQVLAHLMAHAVLEHTRKNIAMTTLTSAAVRLAASMAGQDPAQADAMSVAISNSRRTLPADEEEADRLAVSLASRAGYSPDAARSAWARLQERTGDAATALAVAHSSSTRTGGILDAAIEAARPLYEAAARPDQSFGAPRRLPPAASASAASAGL